MITEKLLEPLIKEIDCEECAALVVERLALYRDDVLLSVLETTHKVSLDDMESIVSPIRDACRSKLQQMEKDRISALQSEREPS